uniref:G-protein coupled receptor like protein n=1 Tax=Ciona intestinalis TaxID=7719 RepID=Q8TA66_CIOIN|nr:G-protein coupled receptor like protein [Ciona intestinalis]BAB84563.1 G-protein coupled receptor like protein [Ciona intestinalis]|eukprot:NP_001027636.1 G-protein coupled receptor like protein [Ciona intestinalis]
MEIDFGFARTVYGVALLLMVFITLLGYAVYFGAIWRSKTLQTRHIWLTSLACGDIIMMVHLILESLSSLGMGHRPRQNFECQVGALVGLFSGYVTIASITWIAIDRYYRQCKPEKVGVNYCFYVIIVWAMSFLAASGPALGFGAYESAEENTVKCLIDLNKKDTNSRLYIILVSAVWFVYPFVKMILYNKKLVQEAKEPQPMAFAVPLTFFLCYLPFAIYASLKITVGLPPLNSMVVASIYMLPKVISVVNPYLYMRSDPELLAACRHVVGLTDGKKAV